MECKLKECQWNGFGSCCGESEEMYEEISPNNLSCKHYRNLDKEIEDDKNAIVNHMIELLTNMKFEHIAHHEKELREMDTDQLLKHYDETLNLHREFQIGRMLDDVLNEVEIHGVEWVRNKYELNKVTD